MRRTILAVDDEQLVLCCLKAFFELEDKHDIVTFTDPHEALEYFYSHDIDVVISDFNMPRMDGVTLLSLVKERDPAVVRILLTGFADKDSAVRAINEAGLFQYIEKPWSNDDLSIIVRNAMERRQLLEMLRESVAHLSVTDGELKGIRQDLLRAFV